MTPGQRRALLELARLCAVDPDGFELLEEPHLENNKLIVRVSIRIGPLALGEGGLQLREREEFTLRVPSDFPFDYPSLTVSHDRFAGFPHVIWSHTVCLYQSKV